MKFMLDCRALAQRLSQSQDTDLSPGARAHVRLHLMTCENCRTLDDQMRFLRRAMGGLAPAAAPPVPAAETRRLSTAAVSAEHAYAA